LYLKAAALKFNPTTTTTTFYALWHVSEKRLSLRHSKSTLKLKVRRQAGGFLYCTLYIRGVEVGSKCYP
jgi:hypothetical protein